MSNELKVFIDSDLESLIQKVRELKQFVSEKEYEAKTQGREVNYSNFHENSMLHNLNAELRQKLANAACSALALTVS